MHKTIFLIQQSWITICFVAKWFVHMRTSAENGITNEAIVLQWPAWTALWDLKKQWAVQFSSFWSCWCTAQCKMLFCAKTIVKESQFWTSPSEEERKTLTSWLSGNSQYFYDRCFFALVGMLFFMKALKHEWYVVIKAYKFTIYEILRDFLYYHILRVRTIPTYSVYQLYNKQTIFLDKC